MHIGLWDGDKPIAAARIINQLPSAEWEHDRFFDWPTSWPERSNTAEISRFLIHPRHRSWETLKLLCEGIAQGMFITEKDYFIACCTSDMEKFYSDYFGANMTGMYFKHSDLGPKQHQMFVCEYKQGIVGVGIGFRNWACLWAGTAADALSLIHI